MYGPTDTPQGYDINPLREKLDTWLKNGKNMNLKHCIQSNTADCHARAFTHIPTNWGVRSTEVNYENQGLYTNVKLTLTKKSFKPMVAVLKANAKFAGATNSRFTGFHYVLLVDTGVDSRGKKFCVVYDPDTTATQESYDMWIDCTKEVDLEATPANRIVLEKMILGKDNDLGPLVRYYYCD